MKPVNKQTIIKVSLFLLIVIYSSVSNASMTVAIDANVVYASDPFVGPNEEHKGELDTMGDTTGYGIGMSLFLFHFLALHADVNYFEWEESAPDLEWSYSRMPVFFGARYYTPVNIFLEFGWEVSFNKSESKYTGPLYGIYGYGKSASHDSTTYGVSYGIGVEFPISEKFSAGVNARSHFMIYPYDTVGVSVGYRF